MTRGGRVKEREEPHRRCAATGEIRDKARLIRFVIGPDGAPVPDLAEKLPGRGVWISAEREALAQAVRRNAFARSVKAPVATSGDLVERVEALLAQRVVQMLSLCRKAGLAVAGFEKTRAALPKAVVLIQAADGAPDGKQKMRRFSGDMPIIGVLKKDELGLAFGRPYVIHAVLTAGGAVERLLREASRLEGFRSPPTE